MKIGETKEVWGSGSKPYVLKNVDGVLSCSCPAWRNQSRPVDVRTCKHLCKEQGVESERARVGDENMPTKFRNGSGTTVAAKPRVVAQSVTTTAAANPSAVGCGCEDGKVCDVSHDPATCPCVQCATAEEAARKKAAQVLLAESWDGDTDPTGWWLSEKLDGLRAIWDGQQFLSRNGNVFHAPEWFRDCMPCTPLDGELWMGRQKFQETMSVVRRQNGGEQWRKIVFMVFDAPELQGTFEERLEFLMDKLQASAPKELRECPHLQLHDHVLCTGRDHLDRELERVLALGGEGLMLRKSGSRYERRRSSTLLKVKRYVDAEAVVIDHVKGKGKHRGRLGALTVRMPDGKTFNVGTGFTDAQRENPPSIGAVITYKFTETTKDGIPKCGSFVAVRDYE